MSFQLNDSGSFCFNIIKEMAPQKPKVSSFWVSDWFECLLRTTALNNLPPTVCARWCFIFSNIIFNANVYTGKTSVKPLDFDNPSGVNYWPSSSSGTIRGSFQVWLEYVCQWMMNLLLNTWLPYSIRPYVSPNPAFNQLDPSDPSSYQSLVIAHTPLPPLDEVSEQAFYNFQSLVTTYFSARQGDGWLNTFVFNTSYNNNANLSDAIDGTNSAPQDLNNLPHPNNWTPMTAPTKTGGSATKSYLTPEWGTANTGVTSNTTRLAIQTNAQQLFPDPATTAAQWKKEIEDVYATVSNLNDTEKLISEYWLQCPADTVNSTDNYLYGTPSPSGVWIIFADIYLRANNKSLIDEINYYATISTGIFEASLIAWKLKRTNLQARPVQKVRQLLYDPSQSVDTPIHQDWNPKTPVVNGIPEYNTGAYWLPYQTLTTVTPPFPDFVSGHSTFGAVAARLLNYLTKSDYVVLQNPVTDLLAFKYTSQLYYNNDAWYNAAINNLFFYPGCSAVQPSSSSSESGGFNGALQVPLSGLRLEYPTWTSMANSNGKSRIYGGVHWESSNQGGLLAGNELADSLWKDIFSSIVS